MAYPGSKSSGDSGQNYISHDSDYNTVTLSSYNFALYKQDTKSLNKIKKTQLIYIDIGLGGYYKSSSGNTVQGLSGVALSISANYLKNRNNWKLKFMNECELNFFGPTPSENIYSVGLLYGRVTNTKIIRFSISVGLGITGGVTRGEYLQSYNGSNGWFSHGNYEKKKILSPSIPLEIDLSFIPSKFLGIGLAGYADINYQMSSAGFTVKLELGRIR